MNVVAELKQDGQFVTLGIDHEVFAVPVDVVVEILEMRPVFRVPEAPPYLAGLIDVRGRSVPVIDLRLKLGLPPAPATESTRILVLEIEIEGRPLALGLISDRVFEVMTLNPRDVEAAPDIGVRWCSDYIRGVARRQGSFVIIFDLPHLFSSANLVLLGADPLTGPGGSRDRAG